MSDNKQITTFIGKVVFDQGSGIFFSDTESEGLQMLLDMRGWGRIQKLFLSNSGKFSGKGFKNAEKFQDDVAKFISDAINEKLENQH
jgi:hypothetical protein